MEGIFGKFIEERRKSLGITLRGRAAMLDIAPAFMSDIEKGHRYPPAKEKLYQLAEVLKLSADDRDKMFDLAARERENTVSSDLSDYIMENDKVRVALRLARDSGAEEKEWQKVIEMLEKESKGDSND